MNPLLSPFVSCLVTSAKQYYPDVSTCLDNSCPGPAENVLCTARSQQHLESSGKKLNAHAQWSEQQWQLVSLLFLAAILNFYNRFANSPSANTDVFDCLVY